MQRGPNDVRVIHSFPYPLMVKLSVADKQGGASSLKALENVEAGRSVTLTVCMC